MKIDEIIDSYEAWIKSRNYFHWGREAKPEEIEAEKLGFDEMIYQLRKASEERKTRLVQPVANEVFDELGIKLDPCGEKLRNERAKELWNREPSGQPPAPQQ